MRCIGPKALLSLVTMAVVLSAADAALAARPPVLRSHPQPPFGSSHPPVCRAVPPGRARCLAEVVTVAGAGSGAAAAPLLSPGPLGFGPADLPDAHGVVSEAASAGGTQTVAIVDAYDDPTAESDLATYRSRYGLPACTTAGGCFRKVDQRGGGSYPPPTREWESEIALDLDAVSAICPHCHILLVEADSSFTFDLAVSANEAAALGATQISNSYGGPEFASETSLAADYSHPGGAAPAPRLRPPRRRRHRQPGRQRLGGAVPGGVAVRDRGGGYLADAGSGRLARLGRVRLGRSGERLLPIRGEASLAAGHRLLEPHRRRQIGRRRSSDGSPGVLDRRPWLGRVWRHQPGQSHRRRLRRPDGVGGFVAPVPLLARELVLRRDVRQQRPLRR